MNLLIFAFGETDMIYFPAPRHHSLSQSVTVILIYIVTGDHSQDLPNHALYHVILSLSWILKIFQLIYWEMTDLGLQRQIA